MTHRPRLTVALALSTSLTGCVGGKLTPAAATELRQLDAALCTALAPLATERLPPGYGALDALACVGEEAAFAAALAPVTASPAAVSPASGGAAWGPGSALPSCGVRDAAGRMLGVAALRGGLRPGYTCGALR